MGSMVVKRTAVDTPDIQMDFVRLKQDLALEVPVLDRNSVLYCVSTAAVTRDYAEVANQGLRFFSGVAAPGKYASSNSQPVSGSNSRPTSKMSASTNRLTEKPSQQSFKKHSTTSESTSQPTKKPKSSTPTSKCTHFSPNCTV